MVSTKIKSLKGVSRRIKCLTCGDEFTFIYKENTTKVPRICNQCLEENKIIKKIKTSRIKRSKNYELNFKLPCEIRNKEK